MPTPSQLTMFQMGNMDKTSLFLHLIQVLKVKQQDDKEAKRSSLMVKITSKDPAGLYDDSPVISSFISCYDICSTIILNMISLQRCMKGHDGS